MFSVIYHLNGTPDPFPERVLDVKNTAEALAALESYKAEVKATGKPCAVNMRLIEGRAPSGFKAAIAGKYHQGVNV